MEIKNFVQTQVTIFTLGAQADNLDIEGFIDMIEKAKDKTPPGISPEAKEKALGNMNQLKKLAESMLPFKAAFRDFSEKVLTTGGPGNAALEQVANENVDKKESGPK